MKVQAWVDITCPYCWLGKRHLEEAARRAGVPVDVEFMAFELQPDRQGSAPLADYLRERFGNPAHIDEAHRHLAEAGARLGLRYDFARAVVSNTFDAHRVHSLAKARGIGPAVMERLMRARQAEGLDLGDRATLARLAGEAGLDPEEVSAMLADPEAWASEVRAEEAAAQAMGIHAVPFFLLEGRLAVVGAQPVERFGQALQSAAKPASA